MGGSVSMIDGHIDEVLKPYPFKRFVLNEPELNFDNGIYSVTQKIYADCVDMEEEAVVAAVVRCAKESGFTEAFLLDRKFVLAVLADAAKKWRTDT